jgi:hypothetical protein
MMMDASASAYWRPERIVIGAKARTVHRAYFGTEWWVMPVNATPAKLGSAIRRALLAFHADAPQPDFRAAGWKALSKARLHAAGVTSEGKYIKGSKLVHIDAASDSLVFTPTRNGGTTGPDKGYEELAAKMAVSLRADDNHLGVALTEAWARCI